MIRRNKHGKYQKRNGNYSYKEVNGNSRTELYKFLKTQFTGQVYSRLQKRKGQQT